jgi:NAD(P)-dependent dehydrogenase (short-subunit alcohol dehydrogenase family)
MSDRTIVITGGSRGLGRATAVRFAEPGVTVVINYVSRDAAAADTAREIESRGAAAITVQADIGTAEGVAAVFDAAEKRTGRVDVLIHSAYYKHSATPLTTAAADLQRALDIGPVALMRCCQLMAPLMPQNSGRIIAISSIAPRRLVDARRGHYYFPMAVPKGAMEVMARYMAIEFGELGATVNVVAPGYMLTDNFPGDRDPSVIERAAARTPIHRVPDPSEITNVIHFLASAAGGWITGETLMVDGGFGLI